MVCKVCYKRMDGNWAGSTDLNGRYYINSENPMRFAADGYFRLKRSGK